MRERLYFNFETTNLIFRAELKNAYADVCQNIPSKDKKHLESEANLLYCIVYKDNHELFHPLLRQEVQ